MVDNHHKSSKPITNGCVTPKPLKSHWTQWLSRSIAEHRRASPSTDIWVANRQTSSDHLTMRVLGRVTFWQGDHRLRKSRATSSSQNAGSAQPMRRRANRKLHGAQIQPLVEQPKLRFEVWIPKLKFRSSSSLTRSFKIWKSHKTTQNLKPPHIFGNTKVCRSKRKIIPSIIYHRNLLSSGNPTIRKSHNQESYHQEILSSGNPIIRKSYHQEILSSGNPYHQEIP